MPVFGIQQPGDTSIKVNIDRAQPANLTGPHRRFYGKQERVKGPRCRLGQILARRMGQPVQLILRRQTIPPRRLARARGIRQRGRLKFLKYISAKIFR